MWRFNLHAKLQDLEPGINSSFGQEPYFKTDSALLKEKVVARGFSRALNKTRRDFP